MCHARTFRGCKLMLGTLAPRALAATARLHSLKMTSQVSLDAGQHGGCFRSIRALCSLLILLLPSKASSQRMMQPGALQPEQTLDFGPTSHCQTSISDTQPCGWWQEDYKALHANIVAGHRAPRYLTVEGDTGMADRIAADVSGFALAIVTNRAFILTGDSEDRAPFSEIYCSPHVDWQHRPAHLNSLSRVHCAYERDGMAFEPPCTFSKADHRIRLDFHQIFGETELVQIHAQNGLLSWLFDRSMYADHLHSLGLTANNAFGCLSNFLFQPSSSLHEQLPTGVMEQLASEMVIGIQIRLGDRVLLAGDEVTYDWEAMTSPWINCAQELEASMEAAGMLENADDTSMQPRSVKWLLISDNAFLKAWAQQQFSDKLIQGSDEAVSYFLEYNLHSGAIDNWLFGLTDYQVISELSHFGRTAALRSHGNSSVFTVYQHFEGEGDVRPAEGWHRSCNIADPDEPAHMMRLWYQL